MSDHLTLTKELEKRLARWEREMVEFDRWRNAPVGERRPYPTAFPDSYAHSFVSAFAKWYRKKEPRHE